MWPPTSLGEAQNGLLVSKTKSHDVSLQAEGFQRAGPCLNFSGFIPALDKQKSCTCYTDKILYYCSNRFEKNPKTLVHILMAS